MNDIQNQINNFYKEISKNIDFDIILSNDELCKYTGMSINKIDRLAKRIDIPVHLTNDNQMYYLKSEIDKWLSKLIKKINKKNKKNKKNTNNDNLLLL